MSGSITLHRLHGCNMVDMGVEHFLARAPLLHGALTLRKIYKICKLVQIFQIQFH